MTLNLCKDHKQEWKQSEYDSNNCDYCKIEKSFTQAEKRLQEEKKLIAAQMLELDNENDALKKKLAEVEQDKTYWFGLWAKEATWREAAEQDRGRLAAEVKEWKHNHEQEVARARFLKERLDMPVERVKAYEKMQELQSQLTAAQEENKRLTYWHSHVCQTCHGIGDITVTAGQTPDSFTQENIPCPDCIGKVLEEHRQQLTAAQQSAQEQRRKGMERAVEIAERIMDGDNYYVRTHDYLHEAIAAAIRAELSKGEGK